jgi:hypothetical protein
MDVLDGVASAPFDKSRIGRGDIGSGCLKEPASGQSVQILAMATEKRGQRQRIDMPADE